MKITNKMRQKYPVLDTILYKTLAEVLPKNRHKKLRDNLQIVANTQRGGISLLNKHQLSTAFTWHITPQGRLFWEELSYYQAYGWKQGRKRWTEHCAADY